MRNYLAGIIGTFALIFIGVRAIQKTDNLLTTALALGLTLAVMISAVGSISGSYLNPAVTIGAWVGLLASFLFGKGVVISGTPGLSAKATYLQAIGLTVTIGILVAALFTGGALNPALAFGLALVSVIFYLTAGSTWDTTSSTGLAHSRAVHSPVTLTAAIC